MANAQDIKYAQDMIPHHEMAVKMSAMEYVNGADTELKAWALDIFSKQRQEIEWLKAWLKKNGQPEKAAPAKHGGM